MTKYEFLTLSALLYHPMHPYAVRQEIIELTQHRVWPSRSTIHNTLAKLANAGYIREGAVNPYYWLKARRGAPYELTDEGLRAIRKELATYHALFVKSWRRLAEFDDKL